MGRNQNIVSDRSKKFDLPASLKYYADKDFAVQLKARFTFYLCISMFVCSVLACISTVLIELYSPTSSGLDIPVFLTELFIISAFYVSLVVLKKGHFNASSHILLISTFISLWVVMWFDNGDAIVRLDTIVYILAAITTTPIIVSDNKFAIRLYLVSNVIILVAFVYLLRHQLNIPVASLIDFTVDSTMAMVFIGIVAYNNFKISNILLVNTLADIREREEAEKALLTSEKKYREMMESLPQTIFESNLSGIITFVNKSGFELYGYTEEDVARGLNIMDTIVPEERVRAGENIGKLLQGERLQGNIYKVQKKNGTVFPVQIYTSLVTENGTAKGIRGIIIDITEHLKTEKELELSEERYKILFNQAPVALAQLSPTGSITNINLQFTSTLGYTLDDLPDINVWWQKAYPDEKYRKEVRDNWISGINTSKELNAEVQPNELNVTDKFGKQHTMLIGTSVQQSGITASFTDITERKQAELAIKQSEALFKTLIEALPYSVLLTDMDERYIMVNNMFCKNLGYNPDEVIGKTSLELGIVREFKDADILYAKLKTEGKVENVEMAVTGRNGEKQYIYFSSRVIMMNNKPALLSSTVNISEKKKIEEELENYRKNLELLVKERTEELAATNEELKSTNDELIVQREELQLALDNLHNTQKQLVESEKMASLGILSAGVAHEINNPLNFIQGGIVGLENYFAEHLHEHSEEVGPLLNAINTCVDRASKIVTSLNHFSRKTESVTEKCDIHAIIDHCLVMLQNQIKFKVAIEKDYTSEPFSLYGNEGKLHQAILNIISNGLQAITDKGSIAITTRLHNNLLLLSITDSGCGISPENVSKIFDPFYTTKDPGKGTGLGLSITYNIIREHSGRIAITSELGKGTTVLIELLTQ